MSEIKRGDRVVTPSGRTGTACSPGPVRTKVVLDIPQRGAMYNAPCEGVGNGKLEKL